MKAFTTFVRSAAVLLAIGHLSAAPQAPSTPEPPPGIVETVTVVGTTPLAGVGIPIDKLPAPVQTASDKDLDASGALDLSAFMNARLTAVHVNEMQGNPYQPDVSYRGYTASPLLGTPQGLSVYMDGVRLNQPFGDVVSWDLIPRSAIASMTMMPGSNPLFGLNTLGGALAIETKNGRSSPGTSVQTFGGGHRRRALELTHGGSRANGLNWFVTGNVFEEDGWRDNSPSNVRQLFGRVGRLSVKSDIAVTVSHADNDLTGNGLQEQRLLDADRSSVYTKPDQTKNRATMLTWSFRRDVRPQLSLSANAYYRNIRVRTLNGDINEDSLDQAIYQPGAAERAALAAAGYTGVPASGATAANTPFPFWRCIGNVLIKDEPGEKCNGLNNRTASRQRNGGVSGQITHVAGPGGETNHLTVGAAFDRSTVDFTQSSELGYLNPDRSITGLGVFADGVNAGDVDGEPYDLAVDLNGRIRTGSVYATDTLALNSKVSVTVSGRYNRTKVDNRDRHKLGGGTGSLDGHHSFGRFNPAAGLTLAVAPMMTAYAGYSEGNRAPTSIELGCADPASPCKLPNAMAGDPPLDQVVTRTVEAGLRGHTGGSTWSLGAFRATNTDDILFVTSDQTGFGYFTNFGETRRQGLELSVQHRGKRITTGASYTFLDATFRSEEQVNGAGNSKNDEGPGLEGAIDIEVGNRMPLIPRHIVKAFVDLQVTSRLSIDLDLVSTSGVIARGNENDAHVPDGTFYVGPGETEGYTVLNLGARYDVRPWLQLFGQINNALNTDYVTAAQLGSTGFTATGTFIARPFPAVNGAFPVQGSTFLAPGAPTTAWAGLRLKF